MGVEEFDYATERVHDLREQPEAHDLLHLYKLYILILFAFDGLDTSKLNSGIVTSKGQVAWM